MENCNINFGKVNNKSVKVFNGDKVRKDIEIIGSNGKYSVWTDPKNQKLAGIRGKVGSLSEVKAAISKAVCSRNAKEKAAKVGKAKVGKAGKAA